MLGITHEHASILNLRNQLTKLTVFPVVINPFISNKGKPTILLLLRLRILVKATTPRQGYSHVVDFSLL